MAIKYVSFDLVGVAYKADNLDIVPKIQKKWGPEFTYDRFNRMIHGLEGTNYWKRFQKGQMSVPDYLSSALRTAALEDTVENQDHLRDCVKAWSSKPYQPILDLVDGLKSGGIHTSVFSNNNELMYGGQGLEIVHHVDLAISSHQVGVTKPDREAFEFLLEQVGVEDPSTMVFVDDKIRNSTAASNLGIKGFHFRSGELGMDKAFLQLMEFLLDRGFSYGQRR